MIDGSASVSAAVAPKSEDNRQARPNTTNPPCANRNLPFAERRAGLFFPATLDAGERMTGQNFALVCLGASAGGVDAYIRLVHELRPDGCCAFVIVNHLRRSRTSLPEILGRATSMPVQLIVDGMSVEPNHVYVVPPNCELTLCDSAFHLVTISKPFGWPRVITAFLKSAAATWRGKPVAVILSGLDADGADALRDIKAAGGVTFVQKRETAQHPDMPQSAINTGYVDFELSPEEIAYELARIGSERRRA